jgi:hypothetical protein
MGVAGATINFSTALVGIAFSRASEGRTVGRGFGGGGAIAMS